MEWVLNELIKSFVKGSQIVIDALLSSLIQMAFYAEEHIASTISGLSINFSGLFNLFLQFGISLIVLKFLKRGFECYILWQEGDPDYDPLNLVVNFIKALVLAISFPILYRLLADVSMKLNDDILRIINNYIGHEGFLDNMMDYMTKGIFEAIAVLAVVIGYIIIYIKFMIRGVEILILRIGVPIACVGLVDNDKGMFAPYSKKFFQNAATVVIQIVLVKISLTLLILKNIPWALVFCLVAIKNPKFLQEFMIYPSSGSTLNTVHHTSSIVRSARAFFSKG